MGLSPETENYRYQIVTSQQIPGVMATAEAKEPGLKSYTGVVVKIEENGEMITTIDGICETNFPSNEPPEIVVMPTGSDEEIQCPEGSSLVQ